MAKKNITEPLMLDSTGIKILSALRQIMISNLPVNDLVTPNATLPLSANMGKVLDGKITAERGVSALYDSTATYDVGDYAIYADALYRCNTAISTPEAFDSTKWDVVDLKNLNDGVLANASSIASLSAKTIDKLRVYRTNPYNGTTTSASAVIGTVTLDAGQYLVWASGGSTPYEGYLYVGTYDGYVSNTTLLTVESQTTASVKPPSSTSTTWYGYSVIFLKIA